MDGFPNIARFSIKLGHKSTSRVASWESGYAMPPDDEIGKMADVFGVSFLSLYHEIYEWNEKHPELLKKVEIWRRVDPSDPPPESFGPSPGQSEPQFFDGQTGGLPIARAGQHNHGTVSPQT